MTSAAQSSEPLVLESRLEVLRWQLAGLQAWVAHSETKIGWLFAIDTALLGVLAALSPTTPKAWTVLAAIPTSLAVCSLVVSLLFLSFASFPRTTGPKDSLIFFGSIGNREADEFLMAVRKRTQGDLERDLAHQCHTVSVIASQKYRWVTRATVLMWAALGPWLLAVPCLYHLRK